jgi:hypothetical protein
VSEDLKFPKGNLRHFGHAFIPAGGGADLANRHAVTAASIAPACRTAAHP